MKSILEKFVDYILDKGEISGILVCGSYAVGLQSNISDVDIRLLIAPTQKTSFKGLKKIDGYNFSYLGRTKEVYINKIKQDFANNIKIDARNFTLGKIIFDKDGQMNEIKEASRHYFHSKFEQKNITDNDLISIMHSLYIRYDYLKSKPSSPFFIYNYFSFIKQSLMCYAKILNIEMVVDHKLEKLLTDEEYVSTYNFESFPDKIFLELWIKKISIKNPKSKDAKELYEYLCKKIKKINPNNLFFYW